MGLLLKLLSSSVFLKLIETLLVPVMTKVVLEIIRPAQIDPVFRQKLKIAGYEFGVAKTKKEKHDALKSILDARSSLGS